MKKNIRVARHYFFKLDSPAFIYMYNKQMLIPFQQEKIIKTA